MDTETLVRVILDLCEHYLDEDEREAALQRLAEELADDDDGESEGDGDEDDDEGDE